MARNTILSAVAAAGVLLAFSFAVEASALTASCSGSPTATNITWSASSADGVIPIAFLWGNGSTSTTQTLSVSPGVYSMTLQATDASSTVATTTCSATVTQLAPTITSFTAAPSSIMSGHSSTLAWVVANASSTSINNGIGTVIGTSTTVSPSVTTIYTLSAINPGGSTNANATVTVVATSTGSTLSAQIQALLAQIKALQAQILVLLAQNAGGGGSATSTPKGCFGFWRDLKHGDIGDDVKELQQQLAHNDPTLFPPGLVTGFFGPKTQAALKMFQRRFGIDVGGTGFFGPRSRAHFAALCSHGDNDKDGIRNSDDADDDNDGVSDVDDKFPLNPNATSTPQKMDDRGLGEKGKKGKTDKRGQNGKHGRDNDDDDDDDDD